MTAERPRQTEDIFQTAIGLPEAERGAYLAAACAGDDALRTAVFTLLMRKTQVGDVTETLPLIDDSLIGRRVGAYAIHEIARAICEEEPELPSASLRLTDDPALIGVGGAATLEAICQARGASPEEMRRALAGDLDRIVLKALRKDPRQRYQSAAELREDISRHLEGRPVSAPFYSPDPLATRPLAVNVAPNPILRTRLLMYRWRRDR
jgi:hypothetical protein